MVARGEYAKGVAKREEILRTALQVFALNGYRGTSLRELAAAVNLTQAGLLHYFDSKEELFAEILRERDRSNNEGFQDGDDPIELLISVLRRNADVPGLVHLYATVSAAATAVDHPAHAFFVERYQRMRTLIRGGIEREQSVGRLGPTVDAEALASIMLAVADGMQVQWMLDQRYDMAEKVDYLWSLLVGK